MALSFLQGWQSLCIPLPLFCTSQCASLWIHHQSFPWAVVVKGLPSLADGAVVRPACCWLLFFSSFFWLITFFFMPCLLILMQSANMAMPQLSPLFQVLDYKTQSPRGGWAGQENTAALAAIQVLPTGMMWTGTRGMQGWWSWRRKLEAEERNLPCGEKEKNLRGDSELGDTNTVSILGPWHWQLSLCQGSDAAEGKGIGRSVRRVEGGGRQ